MFTPAIYYAENGYFVPEIIDDFWRIGRAKLKQTQEAQRLFLPNGKPPAVGEKFSNPDLGKTLRLLADKGPREFYEGEIAKAILTTSDSLGGTMQPGDWRNSLRSGLTQSRSITAAGESTNFLQMGKGWPRWKC